MKLKAVSQTANKIIIWLCGLSISALLVFCDKENNNETFQISKIDIEEMRKMNFEDFHLLRERSDSIRTEYVLTRNGDSVNVFITIGLYLSAENAEHSVREDFGYIAIKMEEGSSQEIIIGDKFWWWAPSSDFNNVTNLTFIRGNAVFIISSHNYGNLTNIAKKIDNDILNKESYITFKN